MGDVISQTVVLPAPAEVMAHIRWAVIALQQAARHLSGEQASLELALTGRVIAELELELLEQTKPEAWSPP